MNKFEILLTDSINLENHEPEKTAYWHLQQLRSDIKQLSIADVSNQRELLTDLLRYGKKRHYTPLTEEQIKALVDDYQGSL